MIFCCTYNVVLIKVTIEVAVAATKAGHWHTPSVWVGIALVDIVGNGGAREVPDGNTVALPQSGIDAIQVSTKATSLVRDDIATGISTVGSAVGGTQVTSLTATSNADRAARSGMQGHLVIGCGVDILDDVDLAAVWPVGTERPPRNE